MSAKVRVRVIFCSRVADAVAFGRDDEQDCRGCDDSHLAKSATSIISECDSRPGDARKISEQVAELHRHEQPEQSGYSSDQHQTFC